MKQTITYWLAIAALVVFTILIGAAICSAGDLYLSEGVVYERTKTPYTAYYCGRPYTAYTYSYKQVTSYKDKDWRSKSLDVLYAKNEADSFEAVFGTMIGASNYAPQQQYLPQATGTTVGGFSQYNYARYGDVQALDVNRAWELNQQGTDNVSRMAAELGQLSSGVAVQAVAVQNLNGERLGAIAEVQELRATVREMQSGLKDQMLAQAELMRTLRAGSGESLSFSAKEDPPPVPPDALAFSGASLATFNQFCAKCHGSQVSEPGGGWAFAGEPIDVTLWGELQVRLDDRAPHKTPEGKLLRMPPESSDQPTPQQYLKIKEELRAFVELAKK